MPGVDAPAKHRLGRSLALPILRHLVRKPMFSDFFLFLVTLGRPPATSHVTTRGVTNGWGRLDTAERQFFHKGVAMMGFLYWALFGLVAGVLAKMLLPGKQPGGFIVTAILGVIGAVLGGWIGTQVGFGSVDGFDIKSMALAVGGSVIVLLGYTMLTKNQAARI